MGELGAGQFGKVEKGIMKPANVDVAIKSLKSNASTLDRVKFLQEAAIMAQFKHHNVVTLHGVVRDRDTVKHTTHMYPIVMYTYQHYHYLSLLGSFFCVFRF